MLRIFLGLRCPPRAMAVTALGRHEVSPIGCSPAFLELLRKKLMWLKARSVGVMDGTGSAGCSMIAGGTEEDAQSYKKQQVKDG